MHQYGIHDDYLTSAAWVSQFVTLMPHNGELATATVIKLSKQIGNTTGIIPLNFMPSPKFTPLSQKCYKNHLLSLCLSAIHQVAAPAMCSDFKYHK